MLDRKFFTKVGANARDRYREHIFGKAKDVYGKKFKGYSTYGSKWVTMNVKKEHKKNAPKGGYSYRDAKQKDLLFRQDSDSAKTTAPFLSGDFLEDFSLIKVSSTGFQLGWSIFGARVKHLADKGRYVTTTKQPLPEPVIKYIMKEAKRHIKKHKLMKSKTTRYKIGK